MSKKHISVSQQAGKAFFQRQIKGEVIMLNLLKFKAVADYSEFPKLSPKSSISGGAAYQLYIKEVSPLLHQAGSEVLFIGKAGHYLIGPEEESWDLVLLVKHKDTHAFMSFAQSKDYLKIAGHRTAALEDSRLLPIIR